MATLNGTPTAATTAPVLRARRPAPGRGGSLVARFAPALAVVVAIVAAAEVASRSSRNVPTLSGVVAAVPGTLSDPRFWSGTAATMLSVVVGLVAGIVAGVVLGLLVGRFLWFRAVLAPYVSGLNAMPMLALVPLVTLWLGYSSDARTAMVVLSALLPVAISTADGAEKVPAALEDAMQVLRVGRLRRVTDLVLPSTVPYIVAGANVAIGRGIIAAVSVEFMASVAGLGTYILTASRSFRQDEAFLGIIVIALAGLLLKAVVERVSRLAFPWYAAPRAGTR